MATTAAGPPQAILVIRHGEKPETTSSEPFGVDINGVQNDDSLLPLGWQRSGGITALFAPAVGPLRPGLLTPNFLRSPVYGDTDKHRTYETISPLSVRLGLTISSTFAEGQESDLVSDILTNDRGVTLICWEHHHIPAIALAIPTVSGTRIPSPWPGDRFDVVWRFDLRPGTGPPEYGFTQIPQQLLAGDTDSVIS